jgi:hypothetical protein
VTEPDSEPEYVEEAKAVKTVKEARAVHEAADAAARDKYVEGLSFVWMRRRKQVGFVVEPNKVYVAVRPETSKSKKKTGKSKKDTGRNDVVEMMNRKNPMKRKSYPEVTPTPAQRQPFARAGPPIMKRIKFQGPSPALAEGDRVVALAGRHSGTHGYIVHLRDIWDETLGTRVPWVKVVPPCPDDAYEVKTNTEATYIRVGQLRRSIVDLPYTFKHNDRVRVVLGEKCKGVCGRVVDINGAVLTIAIPRDVAVLGATISDIGQQTIVVPMRLVTRDWHLGDSVRVRWGGYAGRRGVIVGMASGVLHK